MTLFAQCVNYVYFYGFFIDGQNYIELQKSCATVILYYVHASVAGICLCHEIIVKSEMFLGT